MTHTDTADHGPGAGTAISVRGLVKHYGTVRALDGVDLDVREGTVQGVLGPNGAGKTTLVRCLSTLVVPDAGTAVVAGRDVVRQPYALRRRIGLTGQYAAVDEKLSGRENLILIGRLLDLSRRDARSRADTLLERFSLTEAALRPARTYSGGMRRRLDLAASMTGRPEVLFLDEPTTGLDPHTRNEVWDEVRAMVGDGVTVLLTTQYMEEAEQLAGELTVIDHGRVVASGEVQELKTRVGGRTLRVRPADPGLLGTVARELDRSGLTGPGRALADPDAGEVMVPILSDGQLTAVVDALAAQGVVLAALSTELPTLDEVFLSLTGHRPTPDPGVQPSPEEAAA
ncbi:ATP-binding cassette domain-containing protein [Streptomyces sp. JNUCC 64]